MAGPSLHSGKISLESVGNMKTGRPVGRQLGSSLPEAVVSGMGAGRCVEASAPGAGQVGCGQGQVLPGCCLVRGGTLSQDGDQRVRGHRAGSSVPGWGQGCTGTAEGVPVTPAGGASQCSGAPLPKGPGMHGWVVTGTQRGHGQRLGPSLGQEGRTRLGTRRWAWIPRRPSLLWGTAHRTGCEEEERSGQSRGGLCTFCLFLLF